MALSDLFFGTDFFNRIGRKNIRGDELAAMLGGGIRQGQGALISRSSPQSIPGQAVPTPPTKIIDFDTVVYDDLNFAGPNDDGFTIPDLDPPIQRVQLWCHLSWFPNAGVGGNSKDTDSAAGFQNQ